MPGVQIVINSHNFNDGVADTNGTYWWVTEDIDGWDAPPVRQSQLNKTTRDGAALGESQYGARPLIIRGVARCNSVANYWASRDRLAKTVDLMQTSGVMTVDEVTYVKRLFVIRAGNLHMKQLGTTTFTFEIPLMALDPTKYNNNTTTVGIPATVTNLGNYRSYPTVTLTSGAGASVTITNTTIAGSPAIVLTGMNSGDVIDFDNRTVKTGAGADKYSALSLAGTTWWWLQSGANVITCAGATANMTFRDAWI